MVSVNSDPVRAISATRSHNGVKYSPGCHNVEQVKVEFAGLNFQVETVSRYLGSFIGEATERGSWIAIKVDDWVYSIKKLAGAAHAYPQSAYSALQHKNGSIYNAKHQAFNHAFIY